MRSLRDNRLTLVTGLAAALPVLIATVDALAGGWLPLGDRAVIAVRSFDVLSTHPPLLGQYSSSSQILGEPVHSPGPLLYWLLALPVRVDRSAPALVMGVVNTAAVIASVALARRRGGVALMFATGAGLALMLASLDSSLPYDIWNPAAGLLPFTLLIFLVWSLACGEWRLLPLTALVASFAVQAHLAYALPAGALLVVAGCFLVGSGKPIPRRRLVATLAVLALCWIAPLAEELIHRPGNVERIVRSGLTDKPTLGAKAGLNGVLRAVGMPPWWLRGPRTPFERVADVNFSPPAATTVGALFVLLALAVLTALALARQRRDLAAAGGLALAMMPALAVVTASTPTTGILFGSVGYSLWWASPAGMFAWLALGWLAARLLLPLRSPAWARSPGPVAAGVVAVTAVALSVAAGAGPDRLEGAWKPADRLLAALRHEAPPGTLRVTGPKTTLGFELQGGAVLTLRQRGPRPLSSLPGVGTPYDPRRHPHDGVVRVGDRRPAGRVIARATLSGRRVLTATLAR